MITVTLMVQTSLEDDDNYEARRDEIVEKLEKQGFLVSVESEDEDWDEYEEEYEDEDEDEDEEEDWDEDYEDD